jgi:4-hydroxybenzoate polyprenyltransferase
MQLGPATLAAAVIGTGGGLAYDIRSKGTVWSLVPFVVAFPTLAVWAWTAVAPFDPRLLEGYLLGIPLVTGLHLADTWPDLEDDRAHGVRGLAHRLGPRATWRLLRAAVCATPCALLLLAALPGHASAVLVAAAGLTATVTAGALVVSRAGLDRRRWPLAFGLLVCAAIVASVGWLGSLVA